ncbi:MAG: hypothetical protein J0L58_04755 [Burkholderiales bacterium]|uniref:hypothetical protein n=1 Tax=Inhella sp. TaxID=1921806 RepID=UPI001AC97B82|nr:hypothetical protein [Burkholderiales bacterium]
MTRFNTSPLTALSDALTLFVMAGLTVASAAVMALPVQHEKAEPATLPLVVVTAKSSAERVHLPAVVVTAKRVSAS